MRSHRLATEADLPAIAYLMDRAIAELQRPFLSPEQIAASRASMGLDTQLIADRTYWLIFEGAARRVRPSGCGACRSRGSVRRRRPGAIMTERL